MTSFSGGAELQCQGCSGWYDAPTSWFDGPHLWRCQGCGCAHELTFVAGRDVKRFVKIDRFVVPPRELLSALDAKTVSDVKDGIRAANAGCIPAATVMLRRALERECQLHGAAGNTLHQKIASLQTKGILSAIQASTAHAIRAFGNYGAHPNDDLLDEVSEEEFEAAIKLTIDLVHGLQQAQIRARSSGQ